MGGASGAEAGNPGGGAPGLRDAASTADATGVNPGTSDATGFSAEIGIAGDGAAGRDGTVPGDGPAAGGYDGSAGDAPAAGGYDGSAGDGLLARADRGLSWEIGAGEAGISGDVANSRDVGISDVPASQMLDAAGDSQQIDAPLGRDAARDDWGLAGDSGAAACIPTAATLSLLSTLAEVQETYDVCAFPTGLELEDTVWTDHIWGGVLSLVEAHTCVEDGDPQIQVATGTPFRLVLGDSLSVGVGNSTPLRVYAIYEDQGAAQVRAAYDLILAGVDAGAVPPFPEHYARLDLVCGDPDAIPRLKGWTGRIGVSLNRMVSGSTTVQRHRFALWGTADGETGERGLWFVANLP